MPDNDFIHSIQKFSSRLDWNLLKTFYDIVQAEGITAAANAGWRKQSTISLALKRLEAIIGGRLCRRGRSGFELTDEGVILYNYVKKIHDSIDEAHLALISSNENVSGYLNIATISNLHSSILDKIYLEYRKSYPGVIVNIDVITWDGIDNGILYNDYDIGISPVLYKRSDFRYDFLTKEYHNIYCGRRHPLFGKSPDISALANEAFVLTGSDEPDSLTSFRLQHRLGQKVTARTPNLEEARRLTTASVGLCLLPEQFVSVDVDKKILWPLLERSEGMSCDVYIITNLHAPKRIARNAFINNAVKALNV